MKLKQHNNAKICTCCKIRKILAPYSYCRECRNEKNREHQKVWRLKRRLEREAKAVKKPKCAPKPEVKIKLKGGRPKQDGIKTTYLYQNGLRYVIKSKRVQRPLAGHIILPKIHDFTKPLTIGS